MSDEKRRPIAEKWDEFRVLMKYDEDARAAEILERRRMFYAGAEAAMKALDEATSLEKNESQGVAGLQLIHDDLVSFAARVKRGVA